MIRRVPAGTVTCPICKQEVQAIREEQALYTLDSFNNFPPKIIQWIPGRKEPSLHDCKEEIK